MDDVRDDDRERRFVELYERHYADVLAYARRRAGEAAARDVTAEVFLAAWRRLDDAEARRLPWLYRTAALTLANWRRAQRRQDRVAGRLAGEPARHGEDHAERHARHEPVLAAVRALPDRDRELILLVTWEQLDVRAAAVVVGCSAGSAAVRLHRARRRLRAVLPSITDLKEVNP
jgi:RNA polymerase sigma-70 factor (ECF subfamily)